MPIPPNPLLNELVLEGLKQVGENNPSTDLVTRATTQWIEEIKNDIWHLGKKPKILQQTAYTIVNPGQSRYAYPFDYSSDLTLTLLYGTGQGVSQGGTSNTVALASNSSFGQEIIGKEILMTSGTSQGSYAQIVIYDSTTKLAGVIPDFNMAPVSGDTYMIIDQETPIEIRMINEWERQTKFIAPRIPQYAYPLGDDQSGYFVFDSPPNVMYGLRLRYYFDLSQIDSNSQIMSVLYRRWRNIWVKGIRAKKAMDEDDDRADDRQASSSGMMSR